MSLIPLIPVLIAWCAWPALDFSMFSHYPRGWIGGAMVGMVVRLGMVLEQLQPCVVHVFF